MLLHEISYYPILSGGYKVHTVNAFHTVCTNGIVHLVWSLLGFISFTLVHFNTTCTICGCVTTNIRCHITKIQHCSI